jgi:hypothetical protein
MKKEMPGQGKLDFVDEHEVHQPEPKRLCGRGHKALTPEQDIIVCQRYIAGESTMVMAREYGTSVASIRNALVRKGVPFRKKYSRTPRTTQDEVERLYKEGLRYKEISSRTGCLPDTIAEILRRRQVEVRPICKLTKEQMDEITRRYVAGEGLQKLHREYRSSYGKVVSILSERGIQLRTPSEVKRTRTLDESVFDEITEHSAYWIGMMMADGAILKHKHSNTALKLALALRDKGHVEAFREFLGSDHKITIEPPRVIRKRSRSIHSTGMAILSISSTHLTDALARFGVVPRKSKTAKVIGLEENRDFWRGCIDGDGWIIDSGKRPIVGLCGSLDLVSQFREFFVKRFPECRKSVHPNSSVWKFEVSGTWAQHAMELLYKDCTIALPRKWDKARHYMLNPFVSSRLPWFPDLTREKLELMHRQRGVCRGAWAAVARELGITHPHLNKIMLRLGMKLGERSGWR